IPIFFMLFPRESRKMFWDVFFSSATGGSRYSSGCSLGSRGKCCGTVSRYSSDFTLGSRGKYSGTFFPRDSRKM
ncbi:hypothetical protein L9F63_010496, partial [Diploptera punctata]